MASEIEICNIALSNIRSNSINSFNEASLQAQQCKLKYPILRDRCLREVAWQFNRKIVALASVTTKIFNWSNAYAYPNDCLKIIRIISAYEEVSSSSVNRTRFSDANADLIPSSNLRQQVPYEVFNFNNVKVIGVNQIDLRIDYAAKITDPNLFSDDFMMALSHLLASELAIPIVGGELGRKLREESLIIYQQYMASAISTDMNDQYFISRESDYVTVRR